MTESSLVEGAKGLYNRVTDAVSRIPTPGYKPKRQEADPDKVRTANKTFRDKAANEKSGRTAKFTGRAKSRNGTDKRSGRKQRAARR